MVHFYLFKFLIQCDVISLLLIECNLDIVQKEKVIIFFYLYINKIKKNKTITRGSADLVCPRNKPVEQIDVFL